MAQARCNVFLQGESARKKVLLLGAYTAQVRRGHYGRGSQVGHLLVDAAIRAISQTTGGPGRSYQAPWLKPLPPATPMTVEGVQAKGPCPQTKTHRPHARHASFPGRTCRGPAG